MSKAQKNVDFTQGPMKGHILRFSIPVLMANFVQALYGIVDIIIIGRFASTNALAGVSNGAQIIYLLSMLSTGLVIGSSVLIGQYIGAKRKSDVYESITTMFFLQLGLGLLISFVVFFLSNFLLGLINTPIKAMEEAKNYLIITSSGLVFVFGYNAINAAQRSTGNAVPPLIIGIILNVFNIVLDLLFVGKLSMGAAGAALATLISQLVCFVLSLWYWNKKHPECLIAATKPLLHYAKIYQMLKLGLPASVQSFLVNVSFALMTVMVNNFGVSASAVAGIVSRINSFAVMPAVAMSTSISVIVAQNIGSKNHRRAISALFYGVGFAFCTNALIFLTAQLFSSEVFRLFTDDPSVGQLGKNYLRIYSFDYLFLAITFCINGFATGTGHAIFSLVVASGTALIIRMPIAWLLGNSSWGMNGVAFAAPAASFIGALVCIWFLFSKAWTKSPKTLRTLGDS